MMLLLGYSLKTCWSRLYNLALDLMQAFRSVATDTRNEMSIERRLCEVRMHMLCIAFAQTSIFLTVSHDKNEFF